MYYCHLLLFLIICGKYIVVNDNGFCVAQTFRSHRWCENIPRWEPGWIWCLARVRLFLHKRKQPNAQQCIYFIIYYKQHTQHTHRRDRRVLN